MGMYGSVPIAVFGDKTLTHQEIRVYGILAAHALKKDVCWPSIATIAARAGLPPARVVKAISVLSERGYIGIEDTVERRQYRLFRDWGKPDEPIEEPSVPAETDDFLKSYEWRRMRYKILQQHGRRCACCGATPDSGAIMTVDHIKPRSQYPELALDPKNLQVLCQECNHGKGGLDETRWG